MKRLLALLLAVCMLGCLAACGKTEEKPAADTPTTTATATEDTTTTTAEEESTTTAEVTDTTTAAANTTATKQPATTTKATTTTTVWGNWEPPIPPETYPEEEDTTYAPDPKKSIRILAVGNSFSVDAMETHLFWMLEAAGYNDIVLGNLYIGGCSLDTHYNNVKSDANAYEFRVTTDGFWSYQKNVSASTAFDYADWDVVTIQQVSSDSGRPATFGHLNELAQMVKEKAQPKKLLWHMTWAYQQDSTHHAFAYYDKDQMTMYNAIASTLTEKVLGNSLIDGVIPCGTAVQNMRTSPLGDVLTSDGHHLENRLGDYLASLTWYAVITGENPAGVGHRPGYVDEYFDDMAASVANAIKNPTEVTPC